MLALVVWHLTATAQRRTELRMGQGSDRTQFNALVSGKSQAETTTILGSEDRDSVTSIPSTAMAITIHNFTSSRSGVRPRQFSHRTASRNDHTFSLECSLVLPIGLLATEETSTWSRTQLITIKLEARTDPSSAF